MISKQELAAVTGLDNKLKTAREIIAEAVREHGQGLALGWTGGKDSTLALWLARQACQAHGLTMPRCVFIDDGDTFPEIMEIVDRLEREWDLSLLRIRNDDVLAQVGAVGDTVFVDNLDEINRAALAETGFADQALTFMPESLEGNHLMKTVPLKRCIREQGLAALIIAIRWDEQQARAADDVVAAKQDPDHLRVHPILHLTESDVWAAIRDNNVPFCGLYALGYRSLGSRYNTEPVEPGVPAWEQDLANTDERLGRGQHKEQIMSTLRSLGYM